jgi:hypothetical protein
LERQVAKMVSDDVKDIGDRVAVAAKTFAPPEKTWKSLGDPLVRPEHRRADGQAIPGNLRFVVDSPLYDQQHYGVGPQQLLREPRDPNGSPGVVINCRCRTEIDPDGIARTIEVGPAVVSGSRVTVRVTCSHDRAREAEFGNDVDDGARFMGRGVSAVAAGLR